MSPEEKPAPVNPDDALPDDADFDHIPEPPDPTDDHVVEDPDRQGESTEGGA
jgi:hypothetical protein